MNRMTLAVLALALAAGGPALAQEDGATPEASTVKVMVRSDGEGAGQLRLELSGEWSSLEPETRKRLLQQIGSMVSKEEMKKILEQLVAGKRTIEAPAKSTDLRVALRKPAGTETEELLSELKEAKKAMEGLKAVQGRIAKDLEIEVEDDQPRIRVRGMVPGFEVKGRVVRPGRDGKCPRCSAKKDCDGPKSDAKCPSCAAEKRCHCPKSDAKCPSCAAKKRCHCPKTDAKCPHCRAGKGHDGWTEIEEEVRRKILGALGDGHARTHTFGPFGSSKVYVKTPDGGFRELPGPGGHFPMPFGGMMAGGGPGKALVDAINGLRKDIRALRHEMAKGHGARRASPPRPDVAHRKPANPPRAIVVGKAPGGAAGGAFVGKKPGQFRIVKKVEDGPAKKIAGLESQVRKLESDVESMKAKLELILKKLEMMSK